MSSLLALRIKRGIISDGHGHPTFLGHPRYISDKPLRTSQTRKANQASVSEPATAAMTPMAARERGRAKKEHIRPEPNVNFSVSVGTKVPRTVHLHRLPLEIVRVHPRWRPYEFILVGDEVVVVNPRTLEIVAVMPA
jgi:hypothetical protein